MNSSNTITMHIQVYISKYLDILVICDIFRKRPSIHLKLKLIITG